MSLKQSTSVASTYIDGDAVKRSVLKLTAPDDYTLMSKKHLDRVVTATADRRYPLDEVFRVLKARLGERNWASSFKTLILLHIIMREGSVDLKSHFGSLGYSGVSKVLSEGTSSFQDQYLRNYAEYLETRVTIVGRMEDFTRDRNTRDRAVTRLRRMQPGALAEDIANYQRLIDALLRCKDLLTDVGNLIAAQCFQLLLADLMPLFHILNEAMISLLGTFFTLTKTDATKALAAYKSFLTETESTTVFFRAVNKFREIIAIEAPEDIKLAPQSLVKSLESYVRDPDFEKHRARYLANKGKPATVSPQGGSSVPGRGSTSTSSPISNPVPTIKPPPGTAGARQRPPSVDFFSSLDEELGAFQASNHSWSPVFANGHGSNAFAGQPSFVGAQSPVSPRPAMLPYQMSHHSMNSTFSTTTPPQSPWAASQNAFDPFALHTSNPPNAFDPPNSGAAFVADFYGPGAATATNSPGAPFTHAQPGFGQPHRPQAFGGTPPSFNPPWQASQPQNPSHQQTYVNYAPPATNVVRGGNPFSSGADNNLAEFDPLAWK